MGSTTSSESTRGGRGDGLAILDEGGHSRRSRRVGCVNGEIACRWADAQTQARRGDAVRLDNIRRPLWQYVPVGWQGAF
jgi:hypothetical protein